MSGDGPRAKPAAALTPSPAALRALAEATQARIALGRAGAAMPTAAVQRFLLDHARAREAVWSPLDEAVLARRLGQAGLQAQTVESRAGSRADYLRRPDLGRRLSEGSRARLAALGEGVDVALVLGDGLSAVAVELNAVPVLAALSPQLAAAGWRTGPVIVARQARVALGDEIGQALGARAVVMLIGERPGLSASDSLGAYLTFAPDPGLPDSRRNCVSNIREGGLSPGDGARQVAGLLHRMMAEGTSGVALAPAAAGPIAGSIDPRYSIGRKPEPVFGEPDAVDQTERATFVRPIERTAL